ELENALNLHIDVEEANSDHGVNNYALPFDFSESRTALLLDVGREYSGAIAEIFVNNEFLISSKINRKGNIKILKRSSDGKLFSKVVNSKNDIEIFLKTR
ncbi:MAG: ATPase, partial [Thermoproteota archaeon]|nr:ATPase [Thermoproteota archaeon]